MFHVEHKNSNKMNKSNAIPEYATKKWKNSKGNKCYSYNFELDGKMYTTNVEIENGWHLTTSVTTVKKPNKQ